MLYKTLGGSSGVAFYFFHGGILMDYRSIDVIYDKTVVKGFVGDMPRNIFITLRDGTTKIDEKAFKNRPKIIGMSMPDGITEIGDQAFENCVGLTEITIPNGVTKIGCFAFKGCTNLSEINIPDSVRFIGERAFEGTAWYCNQNEEVVYMANIALGLGKSSDIVYDDETGGFSIMRADNSCIAIKKGTKQIAPYAFCNADCIAKVVFPDSLKQINMCAFQSCKNLTEIVIPRSVTIVNDLAFEECIKLKTIYCEAEQQPTEWDNGWIFGCDANVVWGYKPQQASL